MSALGTRKVFPLTLQTHLLVLSSIATLHLASIRHASFPILLPIAGWIGRNSSACQGSFAALLGCLWQGPLALLQSSQGLVNVLWSPQCSPCKLLLVPSLSISSVWLSDLLWSAVTVPHQHLLSVHCPCVRLRKCRLLSQAHRGCLVTPIPLFFGISLMQKLFRKAIFWIYRNRWWC